MRNITIEDFDLIDISNLYVLVQWPESQEYMDEDWFQEEAVLEVNGKFGSAAYFIPIDRFLEKNKKE